MEKSNCDLCGGRTSGPLIKYDFQAFPCRVSICMNCGLIKLNPRWKESKYRRFYKTKYDLFYRGVNSPIEALFEIDLASKGQRMRERLQGIGLPNTLKKLDIGAGTGFSFFSVPGPYRVEPYAVEASKKCTSFLLSKGVSIVGNNFSCNWGGV